MNNFKKLPDNDSEKKMPPEIRSLIWQRTKGNLGVVKMLLNVMDLFFVKAGATLSQSLVAQDDEIISEEENKPSDLE